MSKQMIGPMAIVPMLLMTVHVAGCGGLTPEDFERPAETSAVIFPDDPAPSESCDLNVPLSCGTTTWSVEHTTSFLTRARRTSTFGRSNTASISGASSRGANLVCTSTIDFVVANIPAGGAIVPPNGYRIRDDRKGVQFTPPVPPSHTIPARNPGVDAICNLWCSADGTQAGCGIRSGNIDLWKARVVGPGVDKTVTMAGTVDRVEYNQELQTLQVFCKLTLPRSQMATSRRRPNDVISTSGSRFVRGYELSGTPLRNACSALAGLQCVPSDPRHTEGIFELCISPRTESCISSFRDNPDPCHPVCQQPCTSTAQCGTHAVCSGGCCFANPF